MIPQPSSLQHLSSLEVRPSHLPSHVSLTVPGSKSISNRALLMAAFAEGRSRLTGFLDADDTRHAIFCMKALGFNIDHVSKDVIEVEGQSGQVPFSEAQLYLGAAGTIARFLPGLLSASTTDGKWLLTGDATLTRRPQNPLVDCLNALGANIAFLDQSGCLPLSVTGNKLLGGKISIDGSISSQFVSGLLMAAPLARVATEVQVINTLVQPEYIAMTQSLMKNFGAEVTRNGSSWHVEPKPYKGADIAIEADFSSASYMFALAALHGTTVTVTNLPFETHQPDKKILDALTQMGCTIIDSMESTQVTGPIHLKGGFVFDLTEYSDQALTLGVLAAQCDAPVELTGIGHIRYHESNRLQSLHDNLAAIGITTEITASGIIVHPGTIKSGVIDPRGDHRCAMSFAVLASRTESLKILNPACTEKTYPDFFSVLDSLGIPVLGLHP
ncbi:MAG: 3-phosphoshikimate 1-carboxyvinyltransferase [Pseudomonadota bacterium]